MKRDCIPRWKQNVFSQFLFQILLTWFKRTHVYYHYNYNSQLGETREESGNQSENVVLSGLLFRNLKFQWVYKEMTRLWITMATVNFPNTHRNPEIWWQLVEELFISCQKQFVFWNIRPPMFHHVCFSLTFLQIRVKSLGRVFHVAFLNSVYTETQK